MSGEEPNVEVEWTVYEAGSVGIRNNVIFGALPALLVELLPNEDAAEPSMVIWMTFGGDIQTLEALGSFIKLAIDQYVEEEGEPDGEA